MAALAIMGEVHLALGDTIRAEDALNRAIQINPASGESHKSLGRALFRRRDYRRSVEHLQLALRHGMTDDEDLSTTISGGRSGWWAIWRKPPGISRSSDG